MAETLSIDVTGIKETIATLDKFSTKLTDRVIKLGVRSGANFILKATRAAAPKKTGKLRRSIVVKNSKFNTLRKNGMVGVYMVIKSGKKGAFYGRFVDQGHGKVAGKFFMKNTFKQLKRPAAKLIIKNIEAGGKRLVSQLK